MKFLFCFSCLFFSQELFAQDKPLTYYLTISDSLEAIGNYKKSIDFNKKIVQQVNLKELYYYKIYKLYILLGDEVNAEKYCVKMIMYNPSSYKYLSEGPINNKLKNSIDAVLKKSLKTHKRTVIKDSVLLSYLKAIRIKDQFYRKQINQFAYLSESNFKLFKFKFDSLMLLQKTLDKLNVLSLDSIFKTKGWLDLKNVDEFSMQTSFLVLQHCTDIKKRKQYLKLIKKSAFENNGSYKNYAYYIDRTLMMQNKKQIFGNEQIAKDNTGFKIYPVKKMKNINNRRLKFGMNPI